MNRASRNGAVELLRFLFACCIAIYHAAPFFAVDLSYKGFKFFCNGAVGVEFFLVLSGFLMAKSAYKKALGGPSSDLGRETLSFFSKKYFSVFSFPKAIV